MWVQAALASPGLELCSQLRGPVGDGLDCPRSQSWKHLHGAVGAQEGIIIS